MVDFISQHKVLLHGKTKPSEVSSNIIEKLWDELTASLNAMGCGPHKSKMQWKKTFVNWKSNTKKKARECLRSEQSTGRGEADGKKLTPIEEKLMSILTWITVKGANVIEAGFEEEETKDEDQIELQIHDCDSSDENAIIAGVELLPGSSKCSTVPLRVKPKRKISIEDETESLPTFSTESVNRPKRRKVLVKDNVSNLQRAAEAYAVGQQETGHILDKWLEKSHLHEKELELRAQELHLNEMELKIRLLEAKNKTKELELKERELDIAEKKFNS